MIQAKLEAYARGIGQDAANVRVRVTECGMVAFYVYTPRHSR